ncbi:hypothetical protein [Granulicella arctica]|uniref:hypothetical protein n=1 Tax=Granulicella arctica TaxID=940613 RepID=UPI0021DF4547|nr:hypothetical protein [Granulicella arctica]
MGFTRYQVVSAEQATTKLDLRGWLAFATGLNLAFAFCYLVCNAPEPHKLSLTARLLVAVVYLALACCVGALGTWITLPRTSRTQLRGLSQSGLRGWIFLPAMVLFLQRQSPLALLVAVISATLMAIYLRRRTQAVPHDALGTSWFPQPLDSALFSTEVRLTPTSWVPFWLSLCLYGTILMGATGRNVFETLLLAAGTFLLCLQVTAVPPETVRKSKRVSYPYILITAAFCSTFIALSLSPHGIRFPFPGWDRVLSNPPPSQQKAPPDRSSSGYQTIVLWPLEKQQKEIPAPPLQISTPSGTAKTWIIPFYGPYWYFKSAGDTPGPNSRTTRGDPLKVNVHSTDQRALLMQAHQHLSQPIDFACCREIQIVFKNDGLVGALAVGISLADTQTKGRPSQDLGIKSTGHSDQQKANTTPIEQTLTFPLPAHGSIKRFDTITVTLVPDPSHRTAGRKVAVERFILMPK